MKKNKSETAVTQSNLLVESRFKLTLSEIKLLLWMIKEVHPGDTDFKTYRIYIKDFIESTSEVKRSDFYTEAKSITESFLSKVLKLKTGNKFTQTHFMSSVTYTDGEAYIDYCFDKSLKPHLIQLKEQFTSYDIQNIINCRSAHSIRLYQLLKSFEGLEERTIKVEELRYMLVLENEYSRFYDFKRFILNKAQKELKKYSDIYFDYETNKRGRNIESITFLIKKKKQRRLFDGKRKAEGSIDIAPSNYQDLTEKVETLKKEIESGEAISLSEFKKTTKKPPEI